MPEQSNLQRMADDNYNSYYDPYYDYRYNYTTDYIIWGSIAGAIIIGAATFFHFMIKRRRNRARRAQLTSKNIKNIVRQIVYSFYCFAIQLFFWPQIDFSQELQPTKHLVWQPVRVFHLQLMLTIHHKDNKCKIILLKF